MNLLRLAFLLAPAALVFSPLGAQTTVSWGTPTTISGNSDVTTTYPLLGAFSYTVNNTPASKVINGVTFLTTPYNTTAHASGGIDITFSATANTLPNSAFGQNHAFGIDGVAPFSDLSADYQDLLWSAAYSAITDNSFLPTTAALNFSGLSIGQQYQVQLWTNDSRADAGNTILGRNQNVSDGLGHSVVLNLNDGTTHAGGSLGQFVTGRFTALSANFSILITPASGGDGLAAQVQAFQLSQAPEPSTWALLAGGVVLVTAILRRRHAR